MDSEPENYELAYLLSPSIQEDVLEHTGKLSALIEEVQGMVKRAESPKLRKLAYPVNKMKEAYFGWTAFRVLPEHLSSLRKKLNEIKVILRYLIVEEEIELKPRLERPLIQRPRPAVPSQPPSEPQKPEEKLDLEALDKKLEEILGK